MLSALPFTVEESGIVVYGAKQGLLHEALALMAITSAKPQPIVTAFGDDNANRLNLSRYFTDVDPKDPKSVAIAHLAAYIFYYIHWNRIRRHEMKQQFICFTIGDGIPSQFFVNQRYSDKLANNIGSWTAELDVAHSNWCREHFINPSAVKSTTQFIEISLNTLSDIDPEFLRCQPLEPAWNQDIDVEKSPHVFSSLYGNVKGIDLSMSTLVALQSKQTLSTKKKDAQEKYACIHFLKGYCQFGNDCVNAHSRAAPRPPCRFQLSSGGCTNRNCVYSHDQESADTTSDAEQIPAIYGRFHGGALGWMCHDSSTLLLLGNCGISRSLEALMNPAGLTYGGSTILDLAHFHKNRYLRNRSVTKCVWTFPLASLDALDEENESLIRAFFHSAALFFQSMLHVDAPMEVGIALEGRQFSRWNVLNCSQNAGFILEWYDDFDSDIFPSYRPRYTNNEPIDTSEAKFYVFRMKKYVNNHDPKMMHLRPTSQFGIELEMSVSGTLRRDQLASALSVDGIIVENIENNWSDGKRTSSNWKLVNDSSLVCPISLPDCNKFELVSPVLRAESGLCNVAKVVSSLSSLTSVQVNKSMGFHVHIDVSGYSINDLIKICQSFVKYEKAIDSMMPKSRRTGSVHSNAYFNSNMKLAMEALKKEEEGVLNSLGLSKDYHDLAEVMNPPIPRDRRYYKLNLQNLVTNRQPTIEFRQHSATADYEKVDAWVRFVVRFCDNSVSLEKPTSFNDASRNVDEQFDDLFNNVIRDSVLFSYYRSRKHKFQADGEEDACCHGCVTGRGCSK